MLLLLQASTQHLPPGLPPINIVVQQAAGLPAWASAIIGASAGAVFALLTNTLLEFVKPRIARRIAKRRIFRELTTEFLANFQIIENAIYIINDALGRGGIYIDKALETIGLLSRFHSDRYKKHFEEEKSIYYEIDKGGALTTFYETANERLPETLKLQDLAIIKIWCQVLHYSGEKYCGEQALSVPVIDPYWRELYLNMPDDGTIPTINLSESNKG